ncbi:class A beta-lactamase-related serine hydrolase [Actinomadura sp. KC06]|uniref:serine hydrolase domain-containing protein n=1 Tax=Actinomadura sp. KC06 TaxID=2530369 RepID=UPI00104CFA91|nr:serine hydrolase domain-containing protein [Actinomadura sp. KC06]TDD37415.1 class A beta-lactamase-related serine hydrolase [Actinomadura sp. KC06]
MAVNRRSALGLMGAAPLAASGVLGAGTANATAGREGHGRVPKSLRPGGEFDLFVREQARKDEFSGTVLLVHWSRPVLSRSYGMADKQRRIPNGPDTIFSLGSITKVCTAIALAQLAEQGKVAYGEKLGAYLDGFPAEVADNVTIHQMLTHTSGMGDYRMENKNYPDEAAKWNSEKEVMDGVMTFVRKGKPHFTPGTSYRYSNSAYAAIGAIVAKVSNQSYYDYVREHIFAASGMPGANFYSRPEWRDNPRIAHPYTMTPSGRVDDVGNRDFVDSPAGGAFSNAAGLVRFTDALLGHKLLGRTFTELITSAKVPMRPLPHRPGEPARIGFSGYGPGVVLQNGQWIIGHNGGSPGVDANWYWYPHSGWIVVFLCNYDQRTSGPIVSLADKLITGQR